MASQDHQHTLPQQNGEAEIQPAHSIMTARQVETKLYMSEERFRSLVVATGQLVWKTDEHGKVREGLASWCAYTGQTQEEVLADRWIEAVHPDDRSVVYRVWSGKLIGKEAHKMDLRIKRYDGLYRYFAVSAVPVLEATGELREWVGTCADLTEMREAEAKLRESERRFRDFADAMPLIVWTTQPDGTLDYYNQRWFTYTGMTKEQTIGWGWGPVLHPDDLEQCIQRWQESVHTGEPYEIEYRYKRFDGAYRWHLGRALPMRDEHGKIILWMGSSTDIDDHKQAEEKLALRARQQALIALLSQQALVESKVSTLFHLVNAQIPRVLSVDYCAITERCPDGTFIQYVTTSYGDTKQRVLQPEQATLTSYVFHRHEPVIVDDYHTDGRFPPSTLVHERSITSCLGVVIAGQKDAFGTLILFSAKPRAFIESNIHLLQTIANVLATAMEREHFRVEIEQANQALQQANTQLEYVNRAQNSFVSMVSHEFRTTLTSIQGFSELMRDEDFSVSEVKEYAADINTDARRLNRMITELLDLERMKSGRMTLTIDSVDLNSIIKDVIDRVRAAPQNHQLVLQLTDTLPHLRGDRDKLTQVIANLVSNAVKYAPAGGTIFVRSSIKDEAIHISVQDSGIGIPHDALDKVFDAYYRIESNDSHAIKGTGLGLPIVRQIVQMHGGRVWAESTLGQGSTFHVTLPNNGGATAPLEGEGMGSVTL